MVSLRDHLPNRLHNALEFPHGPHHAALNQLKFRADGSTQLLQRGVICIDILDRMCGLRESPEEVIFRGDGMEEDGEMLGEAAPGCE